MSTLARGGRSVRARMIALACRTSLIAACCGGAAHAANYDHVYAFGDSYADNGAALKVSREAVAAGVAGAAVLPAAPESGIYW